MVAQRVSLRFVVGGLSSFLGCVLSQRPSGGGFGGGLWEFMAVSVYSLRPDF